MEVIWNFSVNNVVSITHEQNIIGRKTRLNGLFHDEQTIIVAVNCISSGGLSANGNEEKDASNDK